MKKAILYILFVCLFTSMSFATYTYTITEYQALPSLEDDETMLVTGQGGGGLINLFDNSTITVESTSILEEGFGGIWEIQLIGNSSLSMSGGQVNEINIGNNSTVFLSGGLVQQIWSGQIAWYQTGNPPVPVWNPHITIECLDHSYDTNTNFLTGHWLKDGTAFSIYLINVPHYSPAIDNIRFIPEPATLLLIGIGGFLIRRKK